MRKKVIRFSATKRPVRQKFGEMARRRVIELDIDERIGCTIDTCDLRWREIFVDSDDCIGTCVLFCLLGVIYDCPFGIN